MGLKEGCKKLKEKLSFLKWIDPFTYVEIALRRFHPKKEKPSFLGEAADWAVYLVSAAFFAFVLYSAIGFALGTSAPMVIVLSPSMEPAFFRGDVIVVQGVSPEGIKAPEVEVPLASLEKTKMQGFAKIIPKQVSLEGKIQETSQIEVNGKIISLSKENDIVVYFSPYSGREIIHRVVAKLKAGDGIYLLTKGDAETNPWIDQDCEEVSYPLPGKKLVFRQENLCITLYPVRADSVRGRAVIKIPLVGYIKLLLFDDLRNILFGCPYPEGCQFP